MIGTVELAVLTHRELFRADLLIPKLVSRQPPTSLDVNTGVLHQEPGSAVGMSMSGRLLRYLSHPEGYGSDFAWSKALYGLRWHCRKRHPHHRSADRPYWRGALCHQAVMLVVVRRFSPQNAAKILKLDHIDPLLISAFREIETQIDDARARAEKRERERAGHYSLFEGPAMQHRPLDGLHRAECPACRVRVAS